MSTALRFLLQALKTVPVLSYISFALSLLFVVLYLNPFANLLASSPKANKVSRVKQQHSSRHASSAGSTPAEAKQAQVTARKSRTSSGKRRQK